MKKKILWVCIILSAGLLFAQVPSNNELYALFERMYENLNYKGDVSFTVSLIEEKPHEPKTASQFKMFRRDRSNQTTMLQIAPEVDKGKGYLQDNDNYWSYDPVTRNFNHYSIKQNVGDSNIKMRDVNAKETFSDHYEILSATETTLGTIAVYRIETKPIYKDAEYAVEVFFVNPATELILKQEFYGASGRLMRTILIAKYASYGEKRVPIHQIVINNIVVGEKTTVILSDISNADLPDMVFTKAYLEKVN